MILESCIQSICYIGFKLWRFSPLKYFLFLLLTCILLGVDFFFCLTVFALVKLVFILIRPCRTTPLFLELLEKLLLFCGHVLLALNLILREPLLLRWGCNFLFSSSYNWDLISLWLLLFYLMLYLRLLRLLRFWLSYLLICNLIIKLRILDIEIIDVIVIYDVYLGRGWER